MFYAPGIGSDATYQTYRANAFGYAPLAKHFVVGGRVDMRAARGDVPFYQLPFIELRGIPAARYQDENAGVIEAEVRWNVTPRWALIGFLGAARAWGSRESFSNAGTVTAKGAGFRYLIARRLGLYVGVDVARGPEETAFYIQAGSAWR
jgi:hemolysin activation/secretion protein